MKEIISKDKLSTKQKKELHLTRRKLWAVKPVTRTKESKKRYERRGKHQHVHQEGE